MKRIVLIGAFYFIPELILLETEKLTGNHEMNLLKCFLGLDELEFHSDLPQHWILISIYLEPHFTAQVDNLST